MRIIIGYRRFCFAAFFPCNQHNRAVTALTQHLIQKWIKLSLFEVPIRTRASYCLLYVNISKYSRCTFTMQSNPIAAAVICSHLCQQLVRLLTSASCQSSERLDVILSKDSKIHLGNMGTWVPIPLNINYKLSPYIV